MISSVSFEFLLFFDFFTPYFDYQSSNDTPNIYTLSHLISKNSSNALVSAENTLPLILSKQYRYCNEYHVQLYQNHCL